MATDKTKSRVVEKFDRAVRLLALAGGGVLVFLVVLTVVDVFMRKFLNAPIFGGQDIAMMSLVLVVFFGMAYCARIGGHVSVDLISNSNPKLLRFTDLINNLIGAFVIGALCWHTATETYTDLINGRTTNMVPVYYWPFEAAIAVCCGLFTIVLLYNAWRAATGRDPDKAEG